MAAKFLTPPEYGIKLRTIQSELGSNATVDGAREFLNKEEIYKDTEENRVKYGPKPKAAADAKKK